MIELPRQENSHSDGSPSFDWVRFEDSITTSSFGIYFEILNKTNQHQVVYATYYNQSYYIDWAIYNSFPEYGYESKFESRHPFYYKGQLYYLVEATKNNEHVLLLCDYSFNPLIELAMNLPPEFNGLRNFYAPSIRQ